MRGKQRGRERSIDEWLLLYTRLLDRRAIDYRECWVWLGAKTTKGYGQLRLDGEPQYVHRIAAELLLGLDPASGLYVLHWCDNTSCFNPDHLRLGTHEDNMRDAVLKGRMGKKLKTEEVIEVKRLLARGVARTLIAEEFAVSRKTIGDIARGKTWGHVEVPSPQINQAERGTDEGYAALSER